jgi:DNA polymerase (family 10)
MPRAARPKARRAVSNAEVARAVIAAALRTGTVLEIDAMPDRLDLRDEYVRKAVGAGALLAVDSDAHQPGHLAYADELGVAVARRGWARKADVVDALPVAKCLARLKGGRARRGGRRATRRARADR